MATVFDDILNTSFTKGIVPAKTVDARNWFRTQAQGVSSISTDRTINSMKSQYTNGISIGSMYLFGYNPLHAKTLPYYDRFPLIFPFDTAPGGFYGINLHYLPLSHRAKLMDALYGLSNNKQYDSTTYLQMSYKILSSSSKYRLFKPCVKHYLNKQIKTRFIRIAPEQWDIALFLPLQRFEKATTSRVYNDSLTRY